MSESARRNGAWSLILKSFPRNQTSVFIFNQPYEQSSLFLYKVGSQVPGYKRRVIEARLQYFLCWGGRLPFGSHKLRRPWDLVGE